MGESPKRFVWAMDVEYDFRETGIVRNEDLEHE